MFVVFEKVFQLLYVTKFKVFPLATFACFPKGSQGAPRSFQGAPKSYQGTPRSAQGATTEHLRSSKELPRAPKEFPRAPKISQGAPKSPKEHPRAPQDLPRSSQELPRRSQELPRSPQEQGPGSPRGRRLVGNRLWWPLKPFRASESCACYGGKLPPGAPPKSQIAVGERCYRVFRKCV